MVSRLTQAKVGTSATRMQTYVDDPAFATKGTEQSRSDTILLVLLWWNLIKLPLSWSKVQYGSSVNWIGAIIEASKLRVTTSITQPKLDKALAQARQILSAPTAKKRELASLAGTLGHVAGVIPTLWPFIRPLWAVLYDDGVSSLAPGLFHTLRIETNVKLFEDFLKDPQRLLARQYDRITPALASSSWLRMAVDASPWGMGGVKWDEHWNPTEYFHAPITQDDIRLLGVRVGESAFMPVLEALAILIAIRLWGQGHEVAFAVRSDALGAIQALTNLRSKNAGVNRVASELALDIVDKQFAPLRLTHIPGISNILPDYLSRMLQPEAKSSRPPELDRARRVEPPARDLKWWRTLAFERA